MFEDLVEKYEDYIIGIRRKIHENPELSLEEEKTSLLICSELEKLNIPFVKLENNSVVGIIEGGIAGKSIALRADMDALPIEEETDVSYKSKTPGVMHACGHDGHVAMLLGAAAMLKEHENTLKGKVYLCFQVAEEIFLGAKEIIDYLDSQGGMDEAIALHLWAGMDSGTISLEEGARMAQADRFEIKVFGQGGHGARPDECIDPIRVAVNIVPAITSIPTNLYKSTEPLVVHVGAIKAGNRGNIIPNTAYIRGGIRSFSHEGREAANSWIKQIAKNCAKMYSARAEVKITKGVPMIKNHPGSVKGAKALIEELGNLEILAYEPIPASDNFGMFVEKYKGFMAFLGIRNEEKGLVYPQHHPKFGIDEAVLKKGALFLAEYAYK